MTKAAAFITGGSSGIGLALARQLAGRGHPVALFARDPERLQQAKAAIEAGVAGARVFTFAVDVSDADGCQQAVSRAIDAAGPPGWAIASAGVAEPGAFATQALAAHEAQMQVNYFGALYFARACVPAMPGGKLIFVASGAAFFGIYGYSAYAPSKFAVRGLAEVLRVELAPRGISVVLAYPPDTETPQLAQEAETKPDITRKITSGGGVKQPADVARAILNAADKGRFAVAPGLQMTLLLWLHSVIAPLLRLWQGRIVKHSRG